MTWNGKAAGETGKGNTVRKGLDREKYAANLEKIKKTSDLDRNATITRSAAGKVTYNYGS